MEARAALLTTASKTAEDMRVQIRKLKDASMRKHKWKPRSEEGEQVGHHCCVNARAESDLTVSKTVRYAHQRS
jgi:hypothetical protein